MKEIIKTDADYLLVLTKLNRQKLDILLKIRDLEFNNKLSDSEFLELFDIYKMIYDVQIKKINEIDLEKSKQLIEVIYDINPQILESESFDTIFNNTDKYLILKRVLFDLGESPLNMYNPINIGNNSPFQMLNQLGEAVILGIVSNANNNIDSDIDDDIDDDIVNNSMIYDLASTFLSVIQSKIENSIDNNERKELLNLKYYLLFLIPEMEKKALRNHFLIESDFDLTNMNTINFTGLSIADYNDNLDETIIDYCNDLIDKILYEEKIELIEELLLTTLVILLNDEENFKQGLKNLQDCNNKLIMANRIIDIMTEARKLKKDNIQKRKSLF